MASKYTSLLAADKLPSWFPLHHFNEPRWNYATGLQVFDVSKPSFWIFMGMVAFNPIFWNTVARNEYKNKTITKLVGSPYTGCYILAATIFSLSGFRDSLYLNAVKQQPALAILNNDLVKLVAAGLFIAGQVFVLSSMWALGVTGTYLGDYFGILMTRRVTGFPFNVLRDPMYVGSFLSHLGTALWFESPAGVVLAFWVLGTYMVALRYEGPFTDKIYSKKSRRSTAGTPRKSSRKSTAKKEESYAEAVANGVPSVNTAKATSAPSKSTSSATASTTATPRKTRAAKADGSPHMTRSKTGNTPRTRRGYSDE